METLLSQAELYRAFDTPPDNVVAFLTWLAATEFQHPPHIADIGAGPGRLIPPIAALGWSLTAYEPDPDYFEAAVSIARKYPEVVVKQGGFEDISEVARRPQLRGRGSSMWLESGPPPNPQ